MGVSVEEKSGYIECRCKKIIGADINLDFPSVGATENILLATVLSEGITTISNAAMEPEIIDLAKCLNKMGANITGAGTNFITVKGVEKLKGIGYDVGQSETPITPVILGDEKLAQRFAQRLIEEGVYVKPIVFPTVPLGTGRVRNMPTAAHTKEMLDEAISIYEKVGKEMGII